MALTPWIDYSDGDGLGAIRAKLNSFNTEVNAAVDLNTTGVASVTADVVTAKADILALESPDSIILTPQASAPAHAEGQLYYNTTRESFIGQGPFDGAGIELGHSLHVHVYNNTGATILKGMAVQHAGVFNGIPLVSLAIATDFVSSRVFGIVQADILSGAAGAMATFGEIPNLDTTGYPVGVPLYLSDTVAGTYTEVAPDIVTRIGGSLVQHASTGTLFVALINNIKLPTVFGSVGQATTPTALVADLITPTPVGNYGLTSSVGLITDMVQGTIQATNDGTYRASINLVMSFDNVGGAGKKEFWLGLRNVTADVLVNEMKGWIEKDGETVDFYPSGLVTLVKDSVYRLEVRSEVALTNITYSLAAFDLESVHIR